MRKTIFLVLILFSKFCATAQNQEKLFEQSYALLYSMLVDENNYSFKKAVFSVENAFLDDKLDTLFCNNQIRLLNNLSKPFID